MRDAHRLWAYSVLKTVFIDVNNQLPVIREMKEKKPIQISPWASAIFFAPWIEIAIISKWII